MQKIKFMKIHGEFTGIHVLYFNANYHKLTVNFRKLF